MMPDCFLDFNEMKMRDRMSELKEIHYYNVCLRRARFEMAADPAGSALPDDFFQIRQI
jgi:hypothetical protein